VLTPLLTGVADNASLPYASSLCGACFDACPVRIDSPALLVDLRRRHVEERAAASTVPSAEAVAMAAAAWTMGDADRWRRTGRAGRLGRLLTRRSGRIGSLPPPLSAWTASRDLPAPPEETFRDWWSRTRGPGS